MEKGMRITTDMIGKKIIRTKRTERGDGSYCTEPINLLCVTESALQVNTPTTREHLLSRDSWDDDGWTIYVKPPSEKCVCKRCPKCGGSV